MSGARDSGRAAQGQTPQGQRYPDKRFTVNSANRTLPLVRAIVGDIVNLHRDVTERKHRLSGLRHRKSVRGNQPSDPYREEVEQIHRDLDKDVARLQGFVEELHEIGIELKDADVGLVDFPTTVDGKTAYLCWQLGESEVQSWHTGESGYTNREPLKSRPADHAV